MPSRLAWTLIVAAALGGLTAPAWGQAENPPGPSKDQKAAAASQSTNPASKARLAPRADQVSEKTVKPQTSCDDPADQSVAKNQSVTKQK